MQHGHAPALFPKPSASGPPRAPLRPPPPLPRKVMVDKAVAEEVGGLKRMVPTGSSVLVEGVLAETPEGTKQAVELKAAKVCGLWALLACGRVGALLACGRAGALASACNSRSGGACGRASVRAHGDGARAPTCARA